MYRVCHWLNSVIKIYFLVIARHPKWSILHTRLWVIIWCPVIIWNCFKLTNTLRNFMLSENLSIISIGGNHELKPRNSQCMGPCHLVLPCRNMFLKTDQVCLHLFSFSTNTTWEMFDESVNTYRNNFRKKGKLTTMRKRKSKCLDPFWQSYRDSRLTRTFRQFISLS